MPTLSPEGLPQRLFELWLQFYAGAGRRCAGIVREHRAALADLTFRDRLAREAAARDPELLTVAARKAKRRGRVFVDVMRNAFAQTLPPSRRAARGTTSGDTVSEYHRFHGTRAARRIARTR